MKKRKYIPPMMGVSVLDLQEQLLQASQVYRIPGLEDEGGINSSYHEHGYDNRNENTDEPAFGDLVWD